jgi:hypothetical protein
MEQEMNPFIVADPAKCIGCRTCEVACVVSHQDDQTCATVSAECCGITCRACPKYYDLSFDFCAHHDLLIYTRRPPGRSIRPYFTKLLTILKQQTVHEFLLRQ